MCAVLPVIAAVGVAASIAGSVAQAKAAHKGASAEADQARLNANLAEDAARATVRQGEVDASKVRGQATRMIARQRLGYAAAGVDTQSQSALDTYGDTRFITETDAQTIRNNAAKDALGYRQQGLQYQKQGELTLERGRQEVAGTILGGVGQTAASAASFARSMKGY